MLTSASKWRLGTYLVLVGMYVRITNESQVSVSTLARGFNVLVTGVIFREALMVSSLSFLDSIPIIAFSLVSLVKLGQTAEV